MRHCRLCGDLHGLLFRAVPHAVAVEPFVVVQAQREMHHVPASFARQVVAIVTQETATHQVMERTLHHRFVVGRRRVFTLLGQEVDDVADGQYMLLVLGCLNDGTQNAEGTRRQTQRTGDRISHSPTPLLFGSGRTYPGSVIA